MQRVLSTYLFVNHELTAALVGEAARAGVSAIELFCSRGHFDYRSAEDARELASWLAGNNLTLHSIHSPTTRDFHPTRESGAPLSICDPERMRRQEAVDEIKRALDLVEHIPFRYCIQHVARSRDLPDERKWDAAFSSLEHLSLFARQRGVTLALENTPGEMATPANLKNFLERTRLTNVKLCFDTGHAHIEGGLAAGLEVARDLVVTTTSMTITVNATSIYCLTKEPLTGRLRCRHCRPTHPSSWNSRSRSQPRARVRLQAFAETLQGARNVFEKFEEVLAQA